MGRRAVLKGSHTQDDFLREYKECKDPEEKTRWHAMLLLSEKKTFVEIAATLHVTTRVLSKWLRRYNESGTDGLKDQRKEARGGRPSAVSPEVQKDLEAALASPSPDGGHWTGPKALSWLENRVGRRFAHNFGWRWLRRLGFTFQRPRPRSHKAEPSAQQDFKKKVHDLMEEKRRAHPERNYELWCQDQHRLGEKPLLRGIWAKKGQRPVVVQKRGYHWLYLYAFVHPKSGRNESFLMPTVSAELFSLVLAWFARLVGAGRERWLLILVDRAGWHTSPKVVLPEGIQLVFLPPSSPELQPAETLWTLYDEVLANRFWSSLRAIEPVLAERCCWLADQTPLVANRTSFHWLPTGTIIRSFVSTLRVQRFLMKATQLLIQAGIGSLLASWFLWCIDKPRGKVALFFVAGCDGSLKTKPEPAALFSSGVRLLAFSGKKRPPR